MFLIKFRYTLNSEKSIYNTNVANSINENNLHWLGKNDADLFLALNSPPPLIMHILFPAHIFGFSLVQKQRK